MSASLGPNLELPVLLITANRDMVATAAVMEKGMRQFAEDLRVKELDSGHWVQLEFKDEVNKALEDFISRVEMHKI
jgi:soluble epoxide hydrolase/lipid-phosphate phosphatase